MVYGVDIGGCLYCVFDFGGEYCLFCGGYGFFFVYVGIFWILWIVMLMVVMFSFVCVCRV